MLVSRSRRWVAALAAAVAVVSFAAAAGPAGAAPTGAPGRPTNLTATPGDGTATLRWTAPDPGASPITKYAISADPSGLQVFLPADQGTSYTVGNLSNGTAYTFRVAALNDSGRGPNSLASDPVTPAAPTAPAAPAHVVATAGFQSAVVTWDAPADGGAPISGYTVTSDPDGAVVTATGDGRSATFDGLQNDVDYTFTVLATNSVGDSAPSDPSAAVTPTVTVPSAPASISAQSNGSGSVDVTWSQPGDDGGDAITGYTVTADPGGVSVDTDPYTFETTLTGLDDATTYTFSVTAANSIGAGAAASSVPTSPAVTVTAATVPLSDEALGTLSDVSDDQTLTFVDAPAQVTGLQVGDVVVAGVSYATPRGLLRTVTGVQTDGDTTTVTTGDASLDDALQDGGVSLDGTLSPNVVNTFRPARPGITLQPASVGGPPSLNFRLDTDIYDDHHGRVVRLEGSEEITPHVSFSASVHCCIHVNSHFRASIEAKSELRLTAGLRFELERSLDLGYVDFAPIEFTVGPVPVVIVPELELSLEASGEVSAGLTMSVTHTDEFGVDITTDDGHVDADPINEHSTTFTPPTLYTAAEVKAGPRARLTLFLYGVAGPYVQDTLYLLDLSADTSEDPWWKLEVANSVGAGFQISLLHHRVADWEADPLYEWTVPLLQADGPFSGVSLSPPSPSVAPGKTVQLSASVARSISQKVNWSVEPGGGTISAGGLYRAPSAPGTYEVTATSPWNGLKPATSGTVEIEVTKPAPNAPQSARAVSNRYGEARVTWDAPARNGSGAVTGYEVRDDYTGAIRYTSPQTRALTLNQLDPQTTHTFSVRADNDIDVGSWATTAPVTISAHVPKGIGVLLVGTGDIGSTEGSDWLAQSLTSAGYFVVPWYRDSLPSVIAPFAQIWYIGTSGLSTTDSNRLVSFTKSGGGVYLTGERPCCESVNVSDQHIVGKLLPAGVQIGGLGDPYYATGPVPINPSVVGGVATTPNAISSVTVSAPGGMSGVAAGNVLASVSGPGSVTVGAAWDADDLAGDGRLAVLMDINWIEPWNGDAASATLVAQNLAFFLSGLSTPPVARPAAVVATPHHRGARPATAARARR